MDLRIPSVRQALPQDMTLEEVQKGRGGGGGGGGGVSCTVHGIKIEILRFTGIISEFSRITQNSAFDFICRPYSIKKLRYQLLLFSRPTIPHLQ